MKTLKFIGGPWDGRKIEFPASQRHYIVRELLNAERAADFCPSRISPSSISYRETLYELDAIHPEAGEYIEFFRPADWSRAKVLRHVFAP